MSESTRLIMSYGTNGDAFIYNSIEEAENCLREIYTDDKTVDLPENIHGEEFLNYMEADWCYRPLLKIEYPSKKGDYALHYGGQLFLQNSGIEIDPEEGILRTFVNSEIGGTPSDVLYERRFWITIPDAIHISIENMCAILDDVLNLAQLVSDSFESHWDGSNWRGYLTERGELALEILRDKNFYEYIDINENDENCSWA